MFAEPCVASYLESSKAAHASGVYCRQARNVISRTIQQRIQHTHASSLASESVSGSEAASSDMSGSGSGFPPCHGSCLRRVRGHERYTSPICTHSLFRGSPPSSFHMDDLCRKRSSATKTRPAHTHLPQKTRMDLVPRAVNHHDGCLQITGYMLSQFEFTSKVKAGPELIFRSGVPMAAEPLPLSRLVLQHYSLLSHMHATSLVTATPKTRLRT